MEIKKTARAGELQVGDGADGDGSLNRGRKPLEAAQGALPEASRVAHAEPQKDSGLGGTREGALRKREGGGLKRRGLVVSQCRSSLTPWHSLSQPA